MEFPILFASLRNDRTLFGLLNTKVVMAVVATIVSLQTVYSILYSIFIGSSNFLIYWHAYVSFVFIGLVAYGIREADAHALKPFILLKITEGAFLLLYTAICIIGLVFPIGTYSILRFAFPLNLPDEFVSAAIVRRFLGFSIFLELLKACWTYCCYHCAVKCFRLLKDLATWNQRIEA